MNGQRLLDDIARVRAQFQMQALLAAMGVRAEREQIDVVGLDNTHKDGVESQGNNGDYHG